MHFVEPPAQLGIADKGPDGLPQRPGIVRRHDQPGHAVLIHPGHSGRQIRAHDRQPRRHRFDLHDAKRLGPRDRRQHEQIGRLIVGLKLIVGDLSDEDDTLVEPSADTRRRSSASSGPSPINMSVPGDVTRASINTWTPL